MPGEVRSPTNQTTDTTIPDNNAKQPKPNIPAHPVHPCKSALDLNATYVLLSATSTVPATVGAAQTKTKHRRVQKDRMQPSKTQQEQLNEMVAGGVHGAANTRIHDGARRKPGKIRRNATAKSGYGGRF